MTIPSITDEKHWSMESVRAVCIRFGWYTEGTVEAYNDMLDKVRINQPTPEALWMVANDILDHSSCDYTETEVMRLLDTYAVRTIYKIGENES